MIKNTKYGIINHTSYKDELIDKAKKIRLLAFDVDGVLTDGGIYIDQGGNELKRFYAQDGHGIKIIQSIGIKTMIISGRTSKSVAHRGSELDIEFIVQGSRNKLKSYSDEKTGISLEEVCYVGDDTVDIELLKNVGMSVIVPNSNPILRDQGFDCMTERVGGGGAIRDVCDLIYFAKMLNEKL